MFKKLKPFSPPPVSMKNSSGRVTCNPKEILACVVDAWSPIYHRFSQEAPPDFHHFIEKYGDTVSSFRNDLCVAEPCGQDLWQAAQSRDPNTTQGADGWRTPELQALP
eukprot:3835013-Karenia_brevis.AAC.1